MCGRTACFLNSDTLCRACDYKDTAGKRRTTSWIKSDVEYKPSHNIGPKDVLPCVVAGSHFGNEQDRVLCSMMWSMIPPWHEGDYKKFNLSTQNARLENINTSKLYGYPLRKGQRCIVICEGFYEWKAGKTKKDRKQPYYIYATQQKGVRSDDPSTWKDEWSEELGWQGFKVLKIAGLFNIFKTADDKTIYSCTIITTNSNNVLSWLHDRAPVVVTNEEDEQIWLKEDLSVAEAVDKLRKLSLSPNDLSWHTVSTLVNNVLCKSEDCRKEVKLREEKKGSPSGFMASWLKKGSTESTKRKSIETEGKDEVPSKTPKKE